MPQQNRDQGLERGHRPLMSARSALVLGGTLPFHAKRWHHEDQTSERRLRNHPLLGSTKAKLLHKQQGKCQWCGLLFQDGDSIEVDHLIPKQRGGGEELSNKFALHRHCHDARHAKRDLGPYDKGSVLEEPDEAKVSRPVLKPSGGGDLAT